MTFPSFHPSFFTSSSPPFILSPPFPLSIAQLPVIFVLNFRVPLTRVKSARHRMLEYGTDLDQLMKLGKPKPKQARTNDSIALWKYLDVNIFCTIIITVHVCYRAEFRTKTYIFGSSSMLCVILIESLDIVHFLRLHSS
jgi:hypothetical protein